METDQTDSDMVEIIINHKGVDVAAVVSLQEAEILLNDEAQAAEYAESLLVEQETANMEGTPQVNPCQNVTGCVRNTNIIDVKDLSTKEATLLFLQLRTEYNDKFNDKKTLKNSIWQKIAVIMKNKGYDIPEGREGAEKCRQKFANLQRTYLNYIKHVTSTGAEKRDPPPYFDEMHMILGDKDKVYPQHLEDSLNTSDTSMTAMDEEIPSCSNSDLKTNKGKEIKSRFSSSVASVRPSSNFNTLLQLCQQQHEELRKDREAHMSIFKNAINVQNEQRERLIKLLENNYSKKRRHKSSSSDASDDENTHLSKK